MTSNIHSQLRLFTDDCLVYHPLVHQILQNDLLKLSVWVMFGRLSSMLKVLHSIGSYIVLMYEQKHLANVNDDFANYANSNI